MNDGMKFEMEKEKPRHFFSVFVLDVLAKPMAKLLIRYRVHPNLVTGVGVVLSFGAAVSFYFGRLTLGSVMFFLALVFDCADGRVARGLNILTPLGKILDMVADKIRTFCCALTLLAFCLDNLNVVLALLVFYSILPITRLLVRHRDGIGDAEDPVTVFWENTAFVTWMKKYNLRGLYTGWERCVVIFILGPLTGKIVNVFVTAILLEMIIYGSGTILSQKKTKQLYR